MQYAKIKNQQILKFPYTWLSLQQDNPTSVFDGRFTLPEWFAQTEKATVDGEQVVEVGDEALPSFDPATEKLALQGTPIFVDGAVVLPWAKIARSPEEIAYYNSMMESGSSPSA